MNVLIHVKLMYLFMGDVCPYSCEMYVLIHVKCLYLFIRNVCTYSSKMNKLECISAVEHQVEQPMPSSGQIKSGDEIAPRISIYRILDLSVRFNIAQLNLAWLSNNLHID